MYKDTSDLVHEFMIINVKQCLCRPGYSLKVLGGLGFQIAG